VDSTIWVTALTGGTAVLASWVTSHGTARAARIQVEASSRAQQLDRIRELRRAAYADVIERAHEVAELHFQVKGVLTLHDEQQTPEVERLRDELRAAFEPLMRCVRLTSLEGPVTVAEAVEALLASVSAANGSLHSLKEADKAARVAYELAEAEFRRQLEHFTATAREALASVR
jgi:cell division inhibitor SulA